MDDAFTRYRDKYGHHAELVVVDWRSQLFDPLLEVAGQSIEVNGKPARVVRWDAELSILEYDHGPT
jgi:hypothetical protein